MRRSDVREACDSSPVKSRRRQKAAIDEDNGSTALTASPSTDDSSGFKSASGPRIRRTPSRVVCDTIGFVAGTELEADRPPAPIANAQRIAVPGPRRAPRPGIELVDRSRPTSLELGGAVRPQQCEALHDSHLQLARGPLVRQTRSSGEAGAGWQASASCDDAAQASEGSRTAGQASDVRRFRPALSARSVLDNAFGPTAIQLAPTHEATLPRSPDDVKGRRPRQYGRSASTCAES